jgi:hypothetical protein
MTDPSALKEIMQNIILGFGRLPSAKFDNLAEWDHLAPPIIAAAEAVSMALRERDPETASIISKFAADCTAMREAIKADPDALPAANIRHREVQLLKMRAALRRSIEAMED